MNTDHYDDPVVLHDVDGLERKSGVDDDGETWQQFDAASVGEPEDGHVCAICSEVIQEGWENLDTGARICDSHVQLMDDAAEIEMMLGLYDSEDEL